MDWFRHYHGCAFDPKWRTVARRARSSVPMVVFVWDTLMEFASANADRGSVEGWSAEVVADHVMGDADEIQRIRDEMDGVGVVAGNVLKAWDKRQPADPTAAERMKRYRQRQKVGSDVPPPNGNGELHRNERNERNDEGRESNAHIQSRNPLHQNRTEQNRTESDTAPAGAYRWRGSIVKVNERHYAGWKSSYHAIDLDAHLQQLDDFLAGPEATAAQRKGWFHVVSGALRKRHEAALAAAEKAKPRPNPNDPLGHLSPWERTQLKHRAEEQVRAEGENPHTTEGMARVSHLVLESASAQRRTA